MLVIIDNMKRAYLRQSTTDGSDYINASIVPVSPTYALEDGHHPYSFHCVCEYETVSMAVGIQRGEILHCSPGTPGENS